MLPKCENIREFEFRNYSRNDFWLNLTIIGGSHIRLGTLVLGWHRSDWVHWSRVDTDQTGTLSNVWTYKVFQSDLYQPWTKYEGVGNLAQKGCEGGWSRVAIRKKIQLGSFQIFPFYKENLSDHVTFFNLAHFKITKKFNMAHFKW